MSVQALVANLATYIVNPLLLLLTAVGLLVFIWGLVEFLAALNGYGERTESGKQHMFWGLVGMFVMFSAWAIMHLIADTVCPGGLSNCTGGGVYRSTTGSAPATLSI